MSYIDGYVVPVKTGRKQDYVNIAGKMAKWFLEHGAVRVVETWGDDVPDGKTTDFKRSVGTEGDETVVFSWCEWPSKEIRDAAMTKMHEDPEMVAGMKKADQPFSMQRMIFGGFNTIVEERRAK